MLALTLIFFPENLVPSPAAHCFLFPTQFCLLGKAYMGKLYARAGSTLTALLQL